MLTVAAKSPFQSLTINAALGILIVTILSAFGIEIAPETGREIGANISAVVTGILALVSIYGRWKATRIVRVSPG